SARICAYNWDRNPVCETIDAVRAVALAAHPRASASGLRLDAAVRTNVGITNLDGRAHRYVVNAVGERASGTMEIVVPPYALVQRSLPSGDYGALRVEITTDDGSAPWLFFATSIDNATAMATTKIGAP
ncbi:MAG TPA: hypothetical protein VFV54_11020, partial [Thermoanaerobaculia bacterium]|nr:hypothetical protein [Thermoanaerobaculia bacterium]